MSEEHIKHILFLEWRLDPNGTWWAEHPYDTLIQFVAQHIEGKKWWRITSFTQVVPCNPRKAVEFDKYPSMETIAAMLAIDLISVAMLTAENDGNPHARNWLDRLNEAYWGLPALVEVVHRAGADAMPGHQSAIRNALAAVPLHVNDAQAGDMATLDRGMKREEAQPA